MTNSRPRTRAVNSIDRHVGNRLRLRRTMLKLSQGRLAAAIGVSFQQVQKYEKGITRVSASRLQQIAKTLQIEVHFFFAGLPSGATSAAPSENFTQAQISEELATLDGLALVRAFSRIRDAKLRRSFVILAERIAEQTSR